MSNNKTKGGKQDWDRISLSEDYEVLEWSKKLGVTPNELKNAVIEVGNSAKEVEAFLKAERCK
jgi:hypothetical protein